MIGKEKIEEKSIPLSEVRLILSRRKKEGELNYEQRISYEYVKEFGKTSSVKVKEALKSLEDLGIPEEEAIKIVDVQPKTETELKLIFQKIKFDVESNSKKILSIIKKMNK